MPNTFGEKPVLKLISARSSALQKASAACASLNSNCVSSTLDKDLDAEYDTSITRSNPRVFSKSAP